MIVKDFLLSLDKEELVRALMHQQNIYEYVVEDSDTTADQFSAKIGRVRLELSNLIDQLKNIQPNPNKEGLIIMTMQTTGEDLDSFAIARNILGEEDAYANTYAYEFSEWADILGWDISQACRYELGDGHYAASILYEMTFLGWDHETQSKELNNLVAEWSKELDPDTLIAWDDVKAERNWTDSRSEAEKAFDAARAEAACVNRKAYLKSLCELELSYPEEIQLTV